MKLARIRHERCGESEWDADTYVWVNEAMGGDTLAALVRAAQKSYLDAEGCLKNAAPIPNPGYGPQFHLYPNKTVAEVQAAYEASRKQWEEYEQDVKRARWPFSEHLVAVGKGLIKRFFDEPPALTVEASWGHRHGTTIEYGDSEPGGNDRP